MRTKHELLDMVKSRKLGKVNPQLDDLFDVTAVYPFLTFHEAADLLKHTGAKFYHYWDGVTPERALTNWMQGEGMDSWPEPLDYTRANLLARLKHWAGIFSTRELDTLTVAAGKAIFWTFLYALEDGEPLIAMTDTKGSGGLEFYWLQKAMADLYADEFSG